MRTNRVLSATWWLKITQMSKDALLFASIWCTISSIRMLFYPGLIKTSIKLFLLRSCWRERSKICIRLSLWKITFIMMSILPNKKTLIVRDLKLRKQPLVWRSSCRGRCLKIPKFTDIKSLCNWIWSVQEIPEIILSMLLKRRESLKRKILCRRSRNTSIIKKIIDRIINTKNSHNSLNGMIKSKNKNPRNIRRNNFISIIKNIEIINIIIISIVSSIIIRKSRVNKTRGSIERIIIIKMGSIIIVKEINKVISINLLNRKINRRIFNRKKMEKNKRKNRRIKRISIKSNNKGKSRRKNRWTPKKKNKIKQYTIIKLKSSKIEKKDIITININSMFMRKSRSDLFKILLIF